MNLAVFATSVLLAIPFADEAPPLRSIELHPEPIAYLTLSGDGKVLYSGTRRGRIQALDLRKEKELWKFEKESHLTDLSVGDDYLARGVGLTVGSFLDTDDGQEKQGYGGTRMDPSRCLVMDPEDRWVWLGSDKGGVVRLAPDSVGAWNNRALGNGGVTCMALDGKGKTLVVGGEDGSLRFVGAKSANVDDKKVFEGEGGAVLAVAMDPRGKNVVEGRSGGVLRVWDYRSGKVVHELAGHTGDLTVVVVDPKGKRVASGDKSGGVCIFDLGKGEVIASWETEAEVTDLVFLDKGKELAGSNAESGSLSIWDLSDL